MKKQNQEIKMTKHDKTVLEVARNLLKKEGSGITIGRKVRSHKKIVEILRKEFPRRREKIKYET